MAKRTTRQIVKGDYKSWNFILFLTLAFMLMTMLLVVIDGTIKDVRTRAGLACATPTLPPAAGCPAGWRYTQNANTKCPMFVCETK